MHRRSLKVATSKERQPTHERRVGAGLAIVLILLALGAGPGVRAAQDDAEIVPFRLTDVDGSVALRYLLDDRENGTVDSSGAFETQENMEAELLLMTRSYIYHPDVLDMKIGGGPLLVGQQFDSSVGDNSTTEALFNFLTDFRLLDPTAYPVHLYYQKSHPTVATSLSGRFLVEKDQYGVNAMLREPLSPVSLSLDAFHIDTHGSGLGATLDETIDEASLSAYKSYRQRDRIGLTYRWNERDSASGSPGLPIQNSLITTNAFDVDARNVFGSKDQLDLVQQANYVQQDTLLDTLSELEDWRYFGNLTWNHTPDTHSFYRYRYHETVRPQVDSQGHAATLGATHSINPRSLLTGQYDFTRDEDLGFTRDVNGVQGRINYTYPTSFGSINLGAGLNASRTDQVAVSDRVQVFDESVLLVSTNPVDLANPFVVAATVVVRNVPKTQVFVEGVDYRLINVGSVTSIQRLVGGNIADGQTVLLEYEYLTGGTVAFDTLGQSYVADVQFLQHFSAYVRYSDRQNDIVSGVPTTPLNSVQALQLGARADYPLGDRWSIGGEVLHTDQDEDISPYVRDSYDVYVQVALPMTSSLRFAVHQEQVDNEFSVEDTDLTQYRVFFRSRPWGGIVLTFNADYLEDTGGSLFRERQSQDLGIEWVYRQARVFFRAEHVSETLGSSERNYTRVSAQLLRVF